MRESIDSLPDVRGYGRAVDAQGPKGRRRMKPSSPNHTAWARQWAQERQMNGRCTNCPNATAVNPRTGRHYWHCETCRRARTVYYTTRNRLAKAERISA